MLIALSPGEKEDSENQMFIEIGGDDYAFVFL